MKYNIWQIKHKQVLILACSISIMCLLLFFLCTERQADITMQGIKFSVKHEMISSGGENTNQRRTISLVLSPKYYSEKNLASLFTHYVKKHYKNKEDLFIKVYTNLNNMPSEEWFNYPHCCVDIDSIADKKIPPYIDNYDAYFSMETDLSPNVIAKYEYFKYRLRLDREEKQTVVLKGLPHFLERNAITSQIIPMQNVQVQVIGYNIEKAIPASTYYTFQHLIPGSEIWEEIITSQLDQPISSIYEHVKKVNDQIVFVFAGSLFAVTTNGGRDWVKWDSEIMYINQPKKAHISINNVWVNSDGYGQMTVTCEECQAQKSELKLTTWNYGKEWSVN